MTKFITLPAAKIFLDVDGMRLAVIDEATLRQAIALFDQARESTVKDFEIYFLKGALAAAKREAIAPGEQLVVELQAPERKVVKLFERVQRKQA